MFLAAVVGPTGSGKSALALCLAQQFGGEIVNCDSLQLYRGFDIGTAIVNLGGVRFPLTGPARYTMNADEAIRVAREFELRAMVPIHYEGWRHFRQGREEIERAFGEAGVTDLVHWLEPATAVAVEV